MYLSLVVVGILHLWVFKYAVPTLGSLYYSRSQTPGSITHSNARNFKRIHRRVFQRALPNVLYSI